MISVHQDASSRISRRTELVPKISIALIAPLLCLSFFEVGAYFGEKSQANGPFAWELVASRRIEYDLFPEPSPGYALMTPGKSYEWQGIPVKINSHGLRGPEIAFEKHPNTVRILNLGDSIAMGWGVREEETYGRQLERLLNEKSGAGNPYQVINAGVPAWNTENEWAYIRAEGLKYKPDLILLDLTIVNDIYDEDIISKLHDRPAIFEWLRMNTYFWPFLTVQLRWLEAFNKGKERIAVIDPPREASNYFPLDPEDEQWTKMWDFILEIKQLADKNKADFVLLLFPMEFQILDEKYSTLPQELFTEKADKSDMLILDLLPAFQDACQEKPGGKCQLEDHYLFADVWMHPSALGHSLTAVKIEAFLRENSVLRLSGDS